MGGTWKQISKATLRLKEYAVFGYRLFDTNYYGPEGMWDRAESLPLDEFMLEVAVWYESRRGKSAGEASPIKLRIVFDSKKEANKMWLFLKKNSPTLEELKKIGFAYRP